MSITRKEIRQALGYRLREMVTGEVASATTTTLTDLSLVDSMATDKYVGGYVHITSGTYAGTTRRISAFAPTTGVITVSRSWVAPAATSEYEIHMRLEPEELNRVINNALKALYYRTSQAITHVDDQREYALSSYTWLTDPGQVVDVRWTYGDTALEYIYAPVRRWRIADLSGSLVLLMADPVDGDLVLTVTRPYDELDTDDDTTDCPMEWIECAAAIRAYGLMTQHVPAEDVRRFREEWAAAMTEMLALNARYLPRPEVHLNSPGVV